MFADVLGIPIHQVEDAQWSGVRGAALLAARGLGELAALADAESLVPVRREFEPRPDRRALYDDKYDAFLSFHRRTHGWFRQVNAAAGDR